MTSRHISPPELVSRIAAIRIVVASVAEARDPLQRLESADTVIRELIEDIKTADREGSTTR